MIRHLGHFAQEVRDISVETFDITVDTLTRFFREIGELGEAPDHRGNTTARASAPM